MISPNDVLKNRCSKNYSKVLRKYLWWNHFKSRVSSNWTLALVFSGKFCKIFQDIKHLRIEVSGYKIFLWPLDYMVITSVKRKNIGPVKPTPLYYLLLTSRGKAYIKPVPTTRWSRKHEKKVSVWWKLIMRLESRIMFCFCIFAFVLFCFVLFLRNWQENLDLLTRKTIFPEVNWSNFNHHKKYFLYLKVISQLKNHATHSTLKRVKLFGFLWRHRECLIVAT